VGELRFVFLARRLVCLGTALALGLAQRCRFSFRFLPLGLLACGALVFRAFGIFLPPLLVAPGVLFLRLQSREPFVFRVLHAARGFLGFSACLSLRLDPLVLG